MTVRRSRRHLSHAARSFGPASIERLSMHVEESRLEDAPQALGFLLSGDIGAGLCAGRQTGGGQRPPERRVMPRRR